MAQPDVLRIKKVRSNLKSSDGEPWEIEFPERGVVIFGDERAGKSMVEDAIWLANTGTLRRSGGKTVKKAQDIVTAGPHGNCEVFSEVTWGRKGAPNQTCRWSCTKIEERDADGFVLSIRTSHLTHTVPEGFRPTTLLWAEDMTGALNTDSSAARQKLLRTIAPAVLTEADFEAAVKEADPVLGQALQRHRPELSEIPDTLARMEMLQKIANLQVTASQTQAAAKVEAAEDAPLPAEVERVRLDLVSATEAWTAESTGAITTIAALFAWAGLSLPPGSDGIREIIQGFWVPYEPGTDLVAEISRFKQARLSLGSGVSPLAEPNHPIHTALKAIHVGSEHGDGNCLVCGHGEALCGHPVSREDLAQRGAQVEAFLADTRQRRLDISKADADLLESAKSYCATLHREALVAAAERYRLASAASTEMQARVVRTTPSASSGLPSGAAPPASIGLPLPTSPQEAPLDYSAVLAAGTSVSQRLLRAAVRLLQVRAQSYLPNDLILAVRAGADHDLQWGIRDATGAVNDWLSGIEEALVIAALCMAAVPEGAPSVYRLPDVNCTPEFAGSAIRALSKAPGQWFWTMTAKPKGRKPKGVTLIQVAGRKHATDAEESSEGTEDESLPEATLPTPPPGFTPPPPGFTVATHPPSNLAAHPEEV